MAESPEAYLNQVFFRVKWQEFPQRACVAHFREIRVTLNPEATYAEEEKGGVVVQERVSLWFSASALPREGGRQVR